MERRGNFNYNSDKVRGVNLGGWFVLEPWITPSLFEEWAQSQTVKDEYTFCQTLGKGEAYSRLSNHWNNWITQSDFNQIAQAGLNHVRIPIGYWAVAPLDGDPYVQGQLQVLDQAIGWARSAGLKVMLDLHGGKTSMARFLLYLLTFASAPGSQNGFDNSGRYGPINWQQGATVQQTLDAIQGLAQRYAGATDVVSAIELLNEPAGWAVNLDGVKSFYNSGYDTVRNSIGSNTLVTIHDAFQDFETYWNGFMNGQSGRYNVMIDTHQYQIFSPDQVAQSAPQHIANACAIGNKLKGTDKWAVVGEWTGAQTE